MDSHASPFRCLFQTFCLKMIDLPYLFAKTIVSFAVYLVSCTLKGQYYYSQTCCSVHPLLFLNYLVY